MTISFCVSLHRFFSFSRSFDRCLPHPRSLALSLSRSLALSLSRSVSLQTTTWVFVALMFVLPMLGSITAAKSNAMLAHVSCQFRNVLVTKVRPGSSPSREGLSAVL